MSNIVNIIQLKNHNVDNENENNFLTQAIQLYIKIFADPPYYEHFEYVDVEGEFNEYINKGCFLIATINKETVGFMCSSMGVDHINHEIENDMKTNDIDYTKDIYISELGVSKEHRGKGIAKKLMNQFMKINSGKTMFLRTGLHNNDHVIQLYKNYGFEETNIFENVMNKRANGLLAWDERFYMVKKQERLYLESRNDDGYGSGAEYLYGMSGHYNSDVNEKDTEYESGSEYYR